MHAKQTAVEFEDACVYELKAFQSHLPDLGKCYQHLIREMNIKFMQTTTSLVFLILCHKCQYSFI